MQKITPHLWFDKEAQEAAALYTSTFENSAQESSVTLKDTPSGDAGVFAITLAGQDFRLLNGGPMFKFNPSISFVVACETKEEVDRIWQKLSPGGQVMMELNKYPFSDWYGWTSDKFGVSWQIMFANQMHPTQKITPTLMFVGDMSGKAEEAINFYASVFHNSKVGYVMKFEDNEKPDASAVVKHADVTLEGQVFGAMDGGQMHQFSFNEAVSLMVNCDSQEEIDYYWQKLSADPSAEQCGWLKDKYKVSWQIVPKVLGDLMGSGDDAKTQRVVQAFLKMKKFNIAELQAAAMGK